jgi:hypothetical protein
MTLFALKSLKTVTQIFSRIDYHANGKTQECHHAVTKQFPHTACPIHGSGTASMVRRAIDARMTTIPQTTSLNDKTADYKNIYFNIC